MISGDGFVITKRAQDVLFSLVDIYLETREPVGSVNLSQRMGLSLSSATIRNTMADLEHAAFLTSPHTSAGRVPTEKGLRFVADSFLTIRSLKENDQAFLEASALTEGNLKNALKSATQALSDLSSCAGVVIAPEKQSILKHMEFVFLEKGRALVVLVGEDGEVENRLLSLPEDVRNFHLERAANYLNTFLKNRDLGAMREDIKKAIDNDRHQLDALSADLVQQGVTVWSEQKEDRPLIIEGQANLLRQESGVQKLETLEALFKAMEAKEMLLKLLGMAEAAQSVQIFVGAENALFQSKECSAVLSPYKGPRGNVVGAVGVIGPTYMHYRRIIPMVDYTAHLLERILEKAKH